MQIKLTGAGFAILGFNVPSTSNAIDAFYDANGELLGAYYVTTHNARKIPEKHTLVLSDIKRKGRQYLHEYENLRDQSPD